MLPRRWLVAVWLCFLVRALFYCAALPVWEGFDEWSHFGVVQRMAFRGEPLVSRNSPLPRNTAASLELVPLPWELRKFAAPSATHDAFWQLPAADRARREREFRALPPGWTLDDAPRLTAYEGLQGPLYGWIMAPVLLPARHASLAAQMLLLRCFGVLIVSLVVPLTFFTCRVALREDAVALGCAAIVAVMPGLLIDVAHVSNECVAVTLFTLLLWLSVRIADQGLTTRRVVALGAVLGLGLLAKAYFLAALPPVACLLLWKFRRDRRAFYVPLLAIAIAGWWYWRNLVLTGAFSGMLESAALPHATLGDQAHHAARIDWPVVLDSILFSHLWLGSWSTLTVRSWMYHLFYALIALALAGLARALRGSAGLAVLAGFCLAFWIAQLYHSVTLFMVWGMATTLGAYLYAIVTAEVALCAGGLRAIAGPARGFVAPAGVALFALLDLYSMHFVALPYYSGLTAHRANGHLAAYHPAAGDLALMVTRLRAFKPDWLSDPLFAALWLAYLAATVAPAALAFARIRRKA